MTDPTEEPSRTPQQTAADLAARINQIESDLADLTPGMDAEPFADTPAADNADAASTDPPTDLVELGVEYPTEVDPPATARDIVVPNPDDRWGPPIYEGPSTAAHDRLAPGPHRAIALDDTDQAIYTLHVLDTESLLYLRADSEPDERANSPTDRIQADTPDDNPVSATTTPAAAPPAGGGNPRTGMRISIAGNVAAEPTFGLT